ncbi:MAG: hypothetical protein ACJ72Q_03800 [Nitrososphaeraceae archaeon]
MSLAKECYSMKLDLLTNATVVDDAVRFVMAHNDSNNENLIGDKVNKLSTFHGEESTTSNKVFE